MSGLRYLANVATLRLDEEKCVACGMCGVVCPHQVFELRERKAFIRDLDACMECGACMTNCPTGAIFVEAGVGCAQAVITTSLGLTGVGCCGSGGDSSSC